MHCNIVHYSELCNPITQVQRDIPVCIAVERMHASLTFPLGEYSRRKMGEDRQVDGGASCRHVI